MKVTIVRLEHNDTETLGVMLLDGELFCYTLELPWRNNHENISCIPEGSYRCERYQSERFGSVFGILDVPGGRSGIILGHVGNEHYETTGCILLGKYPGHITRGGPRAIAVSKQTCAAFLAWVHDLNELDLQIIGLRTGPAPIVYI